MAGRKRLKTRRGRVLVITALVIVVASATFFVYRSLTGSASAEVTYATATVQRMTLTSSVSGVGNVELSTTAVVGPTVSGEVAGLSVAVGDTVREGQILFTLTNPELDVALAQAENSYRQALLAEQQAELSVKQAEQSLEDLKDQYYSQYSGNSSGAPSSTNPLPSTGTSLPTPTTSTEPPVTTSTEPPGATSTEPPSTTTDTTMSTTNPSSSPSTTATPTTTTLSVSATATPTTTTLSVSAAYEQQSATVVAAAVVSTGGSVTKLDIEAAEQEVESAKLSVVAAQNQVASAQLALEQAQENAAAREVKAPMSGTVTVIDIKNGDTVGQSGLNASATAADSGVMTIVNLDAFQTTIALAESDIGMVEVGQKAVITFDALPDLTMTGKVTRVDAMGTVNQGVVSYSVVVIPDTSNPTVKGGMTVSVNIITAVATDVLAVPSVAVKSTADGSRYVQTLEDGRPAGVTVEVGVSTDSFTEIVGGLTEGQEVITQTIAADSGSTVTTTRVQGGSLFQQGGGAFPGGGGPGGGVFIAPGQ